MFRLGGFRGGSAHAKYGAGSRSTQTRCGSNTPRSRSEPSTCNASGPLKTDAPTGTSTLQLRSAGKRARANNVVVVRAATVPGQAGARPPISRVFPARGAEHDRDSPPPILKAGRQAGDLSPKKEASGPVSRPAGICRRAAGRKHDGGHRRAAAYVARWRVQGACTTPQGKVRAQPRRLRCVHNPAG